MENHLRHPETLALTFGHAFNHLEWRLPAPARFDDPATPCLRRTGPFNLAIDSSRILIGEVTPATGSLFPDIYRSGNGSDFSRTVCPTQADRGTRDYRIDILEYMFYNTIMDGMDKLKALTNQMTLEPAEETRGLAPFVAKHQQDICIQPAQMPGGKQILLLKTLLTSVCERNCFYCPFRSGRDFRRATFRPEEFANLFFSLANSRAAEGIFLSSGVAGGGVRSQDQLLATADILRNRLGFRGYIHLKIMPGADKSQVEQAMKLANRLSVNLEAPNPERLANLAPQKVFTEELLRPLRWIDEIRRSTPPARTWNGRWPSTVTQFVAGGADESDTELLPRPVG
jgi:hypothetical protein